MFSPDGTLICASAAPHCGHDVEKDEDGMGDLNIADEDSMGDLCDFNIADVGNG